MIFLSRLEIEGNSVSVEVADDSIDRYMYTDVELKSGETAEEKLTGLFMNMLLGRIIPNESCYTLNILLKEGLTRARDISKGEPVQKKEKELYRYIAKAYLIPRLCEKEPKPDAAYEETFVRGAIGGAKNCGKGKKKDGRINMLHEFGIYVTKEMVDRIESAPTEIAKDNIFRGIINRHFDMIEQRDLQERAAAAAR